MKLVKKVLSGLTLLAAFGGAAHASMINIGGVTWDPDATGISDGDFTARYEFNEFFTTNATAVSSVPNSLPNYALAINPATVGPGDVLQGVGEITKFNGVNYGSTSSTTGGAFCASCELTFVFGGFAIAGPSSFTNGWLNIYVDDTPDFDINSSAAGGAADGTLFLQLVARATEFATFGGFESGSFTGYFDVVGGIAASNFDTNTKKLATDLLQSASAQFTNPPPFQFIATSTGQIAGNTIPEPSTVFLMSLAMLGFAFARGKSRAK